MRVEQGKLEIFASKVGKISGKSAAVIFIFLFESYCLSFLICR